MGSDAVCHSFYTASDSRLRFDSTWSFYVPLFGTMVNLGLLYWQRHTHPWNFVLLSTFTLMEAFTLGVVVAFYDNTIVMQALYVCPLVAVRTRLTSQQAHHPGRLHWTDTVHLPIQSKRSSHFDFDRNAYLFVPQYDFSGMGPFLFGALIALCMSISGLPPHSCTHVDHRHDWFRRDVLPMGPHNRPDFRCRRVFDFQRLHRLRHIHHQQEVVPRRIHHGRYQPLLGVRSNY